MGLFDFFKADPKKRLGKIEHEVAAEKKASEKVVGFLEILEKESEKLSSSDIVEYLKKIEHLFEIELIGGKIKLKEEGKLTPELRKKVEGLLNQQEILESIKGNIETIEKIKKKIEDKLKEAKKAPDNGKIARIHNGLKQDVLTLRGVLKRIIPTNKTMVNKLLNSEAKIEKLYKREASVEKEIMLIREEAEDEKSIMGPSGSEVLDGPGTLFESNKYHNKAIYQDHHGDLYATEKADDIHSQDIEESDWRKLSHKDVDKAIEDFLI